MRYVQTRPARAAAVVLTVAALGGLSLTSAAPAGAVVIDPASVSQDAISFSVHPSSGACTMTGTGNVTGTMPILADGVPHSLTKTSDRTATHNTDATDITTVSATSTRTITATQAAGQLSHVHLDDSFSATFSTALGAAQKCNLGVSAMAQAQFSFDLISPSYVTVTAKANGLVAEGLVASDVTALGGSTTANIRLVGAIVGGKGGTTVGHVLLPAGTFLVGAGVGQGAAVAPGAASGTATVDFSFDTPGLATSETTGDGKKYVDLPPADSCATNTAVATWKAKAGKKKHSNIKKATFKVESTKVGRAKKPVKKKTTTLTGLPVEGPFTITGTIKLASGKTVTVSRDYQACS